MGNQNDLKLRARPKAVNEGKSTGWLSRVDLRTVDFVKAMACKSSGAS